MVISQCRFMATETYQATYYHVVTLRRTLSQLLFSILDQGWGFSRMRGACRTHQER